MPFLISIWNKGTSPFDVMLSAVLVLRSIAVAPQTSRQLLDSGLLGTLLNLLRAQQEDDEFVLQVVSALYFVFIIIIKSVLLSVSPFIDTSRLLPTTTPLRNERRTFEQGQFFHSHKSPVFYFILFCLYSSFSNCVFIDNSMKT